ncbi:hypothetical protein CAC42_4285 [Sphaceloma murrayae]|uniref:Protein SIP5 n=1 Tax=Sphaceloma murrayae TaxID=2082308 RepID=A0A2K1QLZ0_9PEZI|nr:hypothetical protein CAC42_4285 [Sphaceloma murrayae]
MGNSAGKESRGQQRSRPGSIRNASTSEPSEGTNPAAALRFPSGAGGSISSARGGRNAGRPELALFHLGLSERDPNKEERPRETKQEREARRLEKERAAREKEREKSLKDENVDGGYLVTLGTYTGPEDFSKAIVRQLQIERRLAPFWRGLNDHKDSWTEHQLVAAARGLPIPAPDEIPVELQRTASEMTNAEPASKPTEAEVNKLTLPISSRSPSNQSELSMNLSASHPAFSNSGPASPTSPPSGGMHLFRGRAKTLASLTSAASRSNSNTQLVPQEIQLPKEPNVNGQPLEAYLYKDAQECPICFLYYPPFLNRTRCCDQPICSECFVQIKRPDPHPPEHHDDPSNPAPEPKPEEEGLLVSEPSACPYCATPEFGVTYESPPFRRGLAYAGGQGGHPLASATSAMSSSTSLGSMGSRRRTTSLSASDKTVITTDRVRPDWAKKLADARAHALRRSAAATALHNAAYVLGNTQNIDLRAFNLSRRRRLFGEGSAGGQPPGIPEGVSLSSFLGRPDGGTPVEGDSPQRGGRRSRVDDLEDLMMMEAIRLSLAAEEDRKRREEKDAAKEARKRAKEEAKAQKKADKAAKKAEKAGSLYAASANVSTSTWATSSMTRSTSNLGHGFGSGGPTSGTASPSVVGKGKAPVGTMGFNPLDEPTSTLNRERSGTDVRAEGAQRHLEASRKNLSQPSLPISVPTPKDGLAAESARVGKAHHRQFSGTSSVASSVMESAPESLREETGLGTSATSTGGDREGRETPPTSAAAAAAAAAMEPMLNFRSLAAMIGEEEKKEGQAEHRENVDAGVGEMAIEGKVKAKEGAEAKTVTENRARGDSGESSSSGPVFDDLDKGKQSERAQGDGKPAGDVHVVAAKEENENVTQ